MDNGLLEKWKINRNLSIPLFKQLADNIRFTISLGHISPGTKLPPVRALAKDLNLSNDTVRSAYKLLKEMGLIITRPHHGTEIVSLLGIKEPVLKHTETSYHASFHKLIHECLNNGKSIDEIKAIFNDSLEQIIAPAKTNSLLFVECDSYDQVISNQIGKFLNTDLDFALLNELNDVISKMDYDKKTYKAVITTYFHYAPVYEAFTPYNIPVYGIVIEMNSETLNHIATLPLSAKVGVLCQDIHSPLQLSNIIRGIRTDLEIRSAKQSNAKDYFDIIHWADALVVTHPCEKDVVAIRSDCLPYFFYDQINMQSLKLLAQNLQKLI